MFQYEKALQYPVKIARPNARLAKMIMSQLGGPNGELGASMRYLNQRYTMPLRELQGLLTDIGTEELSHMEMVSSIVYQLTKGMTPEQLEAQGFADYFVDHTTGIYPVSASGIPFSAATFQSVGDAIADLNEDLAAEQKARTTYDNILRLADDPDVRDVIRFLREREIVHYQRFGEGLRLIQDQLSRYTPDPSNPYAVNPSFDPIGGPPQPRMRKRSSI
ncbi:MAG: manganese catalase family protein [Oscillospiraceae bacterium]|nr:manganese catalase family protein [Oscillospiraceae bacterium]